MFHYKPTPRSLNFLYSNLAYIGTLISQTWSILFIFYLNWKEEIVPKSGGKKRLSKIRKEWKKWKADILLLNPWDELPVNFKCILYFLSLFSCLVRFTYFLLAFCSLIYNIYFNDGISQVYLPLLALKPGSFFIQCFYNEISKVNRRDGNRERKKMILLEYYNLRIIYNKD